MCANTHFYVMITQFVLSICFIFSLIHSYDIQNIFSDVFYSASQTSLRTVMFMAHSYMSWQQKDGVRGAH